MSKPLFSIHIADVSVFARTLGQALHQRHAAKPEPPGQVEMLNLIARAHGQRNWQALRRALRQAPLSPPLSPPSEPPSEPPSIPLSTRPATPALPLSSNARKALALFDNQGRMQRWPVKFSVQKLAMWVLWTRFDAKRLYAESEVNAVLKTSNQFIDHVTLRRELINHQLMARKSDCSEYRKLPARPDDETRALLSAWRARCRQG